MLFAVGRSSGASAQHLSARSHKRLHDAPDGDCSGTLAGRANSVITAMITTESSFKFEKGTSPVRTWSDIVKNSRIFSSDIAHLHYEHTVRVNIAVPRFFAPFINFGTLPASRAGSAQRSGRRAARQLGQAEVGKQGLSTIRYEDIGSFDVPVD
jgi:hypothetical protein